MRLLHHLGRSIPVWPFDPLPDRGTVIAEIYTSIAARAAGLRKGLSKLRHTQALNDALAAFGSRPWAGGGTLSDHQTDVLMTAAWLRAYAGHAELWRPPGLTQAIAETEGWTLGVV
jgi:hypothetical protein